MIETKNQELLPVALVGCDFRRAPLRWRSVLVLAELEALNFVENLRKAELAQGFVFLNTCNRNEWIVASDKPVWALQVLKAQMVERLQKRAPEIGPLPVPYALAGIEAARHILQVAVGLESFVVGERQIGGQLKRAFEEARRKRMSCPILNKLASCASRLAREVNKAGYFAELSRGVHGLAYRVLMQTLPQKPSSKIILVGLGEIGRKLWGLLAVDSRFSVIPCNRTIRPEDKDKVLPLSLLPQRIPEAGALVVCTSAPDPIILPEQIPRRRDNRQLLILDLGIPEQVGPVPKDRKDVMRVGLDQLLSDAYGGQSDQQAIRLVGRLVEGALETFVEYCRKREFVRLLQQIQSGRERYLSQVIPRFVRELQSNLSPQERSRLEWKLKGLIRRYTHCVFNSINVTLGGSSPQASDER